MPNLAAGAAMWKIAEGYENWQISPRSDRSPDQAAAPGTKIRDPYRGARNVGTLARWLRPLCRSSPCEPQLSALGQDRRPLLGGPSPARLGRVVLQFRRGANSLLRSTSSASRSPRRLSESAAGSSPRSPLGFDS